jgi:hypothetical protein
MAPMTSFIEIPQLAFDGREIPSAYVNVADIISIRPEYNGQVRLEIRHLGTDGMSVSLKTYIPLESLLGALDQLTRHPGVHEWAQTVKQTRALTMRPVLEEAAQRERNGTGR